MVCCSLPAYRAAAAQLFPSLFDGTSGYSSRRKEKDYRKPGQSFRSMFSTNVTSAFDSKKHPTTRVEQQSIELSRASIDEGHGSDDQLCSPTKATGPESTRDPTRELERPALDQIELRPIPKRSDSMNLPEPIHPNSHPFAHSVIPKKSIASSLRAMASRRFSFDSAYDLERQHLTAQDPQQDQGPPYADANDKRRKRITLELDLERQGSENSELKDNLRDRVRERREKTASRGSISGLASPDGGWWGGLKSGGSWNPNGRENRGREVGSI